MEVLTGIVLIVVVLFATFAGILSRYRKCPSDKILVLYGKVGPDKEVKQSRQNVFMAAVLLLFRTAILSVFGLDADFN